MDKYTLITVSPIVDGERGFCIAAELCGHVEDIVEKFLFKFTVYTVGDGGSTDFIAETDDCFAIPVSALADRDYTMQRKMMIATLAGFALHLERHGDDLSECALPGRFGADFLTWLQANHFTLGWYCANMPYLMANGK